MAPINRKWDAYLTLHITNRCDYGMDCVGTNRYGKRCRWDIPNDKYERVRAILDEIETHAPSEASTSFARLARMSLCQDWHQNQAREKIREWTAAMQEVVEVYEENSLKEDNQKLEEMLELETIRAENLEQQTNALRDEIKSLHAIVVKQDSSLQQAKYELLTELEARVNAEKEVKENTDLIQKMTIDHKVFEIRTGETIHLLRQKKQKDSAKLSKIQDQLESSQKAFLEKHQKLQKMTALSQWQSKEMETLSADLEELDQSETLLLAQKFDLTYELEVERHRIVTIESKLADVTTDEDMALQEKADLQARLDSMTAEFDKLRESLLEVNTARDKLLEEKECLELQLSTEMQKSKEMAQTISNHTALIKNTQTMTASLSAKQHTIDELQQALKSTKSDLSSSQTQLRNTNEDLSRSKQELANSRASNTKAQNETEEARRTATAREEQMLARIEALMQQSGYSKKHPFRTFFVNLGGKLSRRMKAEAVETA